MLEVGIPDGVAMPAQRSGPEATPSLGYTRKEVHMASTIQGLKLAAFAGALPLERLETYRESYEQNRHRIYALAFWMTDNELTADDLMSRAFHRAFAMSAQPSPVMIDRALLSELRELGPIGVLTLDCAASNEVVAVRRNILRVHLERAVVQLPATERLIFLMHDVENYDHARIARLLGISKAESQSGLHQARLRIRELVAGMQR